MLNVAHKSIFLLILIDSDWREMCLAVRLWSTVRAPPHFVVTTLLAPSSPYYILLDYSTISFELEEITAVRLA